jgi:hypothetical protein
MMTGIRNDDDDYSEEDLDRQVSETTAAIENMKKEFGADEAFGDINMNTLEEYVMPGNLVSGVQDAWKTFVNSAQSPEAAGEAIYTAIFEGAPSLQYLFTAPRAVLAMEFMNGFKSFVSELEDPPKLKMLAETLGFQLLHIDVSVPRVVVFRDAILDLFQIELGEKFTPDALEGLKRILNYVGGAVIFVKAHYAGRITCLLNSWKVCNKETTTLDTEEEEAEETGGYLHVKHYEHSKKQSKWSLSRFVQSQQFNKEDNDAKRETAKENAEDTSKKKGSYEVQNVPTVYPDMFLFNAAVMGFGQSEWMHEVLDCFHDIVVNVANSSRLQQECAVLALRISKKNPGQVNLNEYKSCMLASLRSLLPKDWDSAHEVAWTWLWENVERMVLNIHGKPPIWEKALSKFLDSLDEDQRFEVRKQIYIRFFSVAPQGQDFFKQSNTYLHFIAERVLQMTLEMYREPAKMVDDISALGLRHVGYGIPTEIVNPFVQSCVDVIRTVAPDEITVEAYRSSLGLIANILGRTITEGATVVMKAINVNKGLQLKKAVSGAPRGERSSWMLTVQVGTQNISPLAWSLESGSLDATIAIFKDLLTIRADREKYYYGLDELFARHPDIIDRVCIEAPAILPMVLDGLIWRSHQTEGSLRRVNYYVKHLLVDEDGNFSKTLEWVTRLKDPKIVTHPMVVLVSDLLWQRVVYPTFLFGKTWFLLTLMLFVTSQSVLQYIGDTSKMSDTQRIIVFACRAFIYLCSMTQLIYCHSRDTFKAFREGDIYPILFVWVPCYLKKWQEAASCALAVSLVVMLIIEPIAACWRYRGNTWFDAACSEGEDQRAVYEFFSMCATFLYYTLLIDFAAISTRLSAFVLICIRMTPEVSLFFVAITSFILSFASAISVVKHSDESFAGILDGSYSLLRMVLGMFDTSLYHRLEAEPTVLLMVFIFLIITTMFLISLFIAQLSCAYSSVYEDMVGYARLERGAIIVEMMPNVPKRRFYNFLRDMQFSKRIEFNAGDVGLAGGVQVTEPSSVNPTTVDSIKRFGGSTNAEIAWPADEEGESTEADHFDRIEKLMHRALKRVTDAKKSASRARRTGSQDGPSGSGEGPSGSGDSMDSASSVISPGSPSGRI